MKRFQECNKLEKVWRYRWYLTIPFLFIKNKFTIKTIPIDRWDEETEKIVSENSTVPSNKLLWSLCIGHVQIKMKWYYTIEETFENISNEIRY